MNYPFFVGPSYTAASVVAGAEQCMNWYPEVLQSPGAKARTMLLPTPGVRLVAKPPHPAPGRGLWSQNDRCYAVIGKELYEIEHGGQLRERGNVGSDAAPVTQFSTGHGSEELFITSAGTGFVLDLTSNRLAPVAALIDKATQGAFLNSRLIALDAATSTVRLSDLNRGQSWPGLYALQRSQAADRLRAIHVLHNQLWLFGEETSEVWADVGARHLPFAPIPGVFIEQGIDAPWSIAELDSSLCWLGREQEGRGIVWRSEGYRPVRISTHAVEHAISTYPETEAAIGWSYQNRGHSFYVLAFPAAGATWVYDAATGFWHERGTWNSEAGRYDALRAQQHCFWGGQHLVQDRETGAIYALDEDSAVDVTSEPIRRLRRAPHVTNEQRRVFFHELQVDVETGAADLDGDRRDPQLGLRWSNDGGRTWSNQHWAGYGALGEYDTRVIWRRLGQGRNRVFELVSADPVPTRIVNAHLRVEGAVH